MAVLKNAFGMRIAIVSHSSNLEGAERSLLEVIDGLKKNGHEVLVIVRESGDFTSVLKERGIQFYNLKYGWWHTEGAFFPKFWLQKAERIASDMANVLSDFKADLVYTNTSVIPYGAIAAIKAGLPHIWHIRELASGSVFDPYRGSLEAIGNFISLVSNRIIFNSKATKLSWVPFLRDVSGMEVIYNPIARKDVKKKARGDAFRVALVGSVLPIKNQMEALKAFAMDRIRQSSLELEIIGPVRNEMYYNSLRDYIEEKGLHEKVYFKGYKENPFSEYPDLCLVCGNREGFGRVTAEAILSEIPVLAASGGATDELIREGETGFLYESGNINALADRLFELSNRDLESHVRHSLQLVSEMLSESNTIQKLTSLIEEVPGEKNPLAVLSMFLNPYQDHKEHLEFVKSIDLLKEIVRRKLM